MKQALFLSHGGGPLPLLGDASHHEMVACLKQIAANIPKPDAILIISAHWETQTPTITASASPSLIYDYHGFPDEAYTIEYPCPGSPELAEVVHSLLRGADMDAVLDDERGLDHGVFVPLKIMYPEADIPCVQLSMLSALDPVAHIKLGQALQPLQDKKVLLIGSGFSFHNMQAFFAKHAEEADLQNHAFESWLMDTCVNNTYSEQERQQLLINWRQAPGGRFCHPREEHLLPLHVCYGFAESPSSAHFSIEILNKKASFYLWD